MRSANELSSVEHCEASNAHRPWVSFCVATYRRPARLRDMLVAILQQSFSDFEVVVSDNDPTQSSRQVVEYFRDKRCRYYANEENVGMVKNFNNALHHSKGLYVVMITDDDPPYSNMLEELHELTMAYPGYGAYYGACEVLVETDAVSQTLGAKIGKKAFLTNDAVGAVRTYKSAEFLRAFFRRKIFRYMLWSTGIVEREIALRIGGMPDYGSPFLTDFGYVILAGEQKGFVALNKALGYQAVHGENSGFLHPHALRKALEGCSKYLASHLSRRPDWPALRPKMHAFLGLSIVDQIASMERYRRGLGNQTASIKTSFETFESFMDIPYMRSLRFRYFGMTVLLNYPLALRLYRAMRNLTRIVANVWRRRS